MNTYNNIHRLYDLLIEFEKNINFLSSRGATSLTVFVENLASKLLEIYFGCKFYNINYIQHNTSGIDLLSENKKHGVQVTIEKNNSKKVIDAINKSKNIEKLTVFFFNHNDTKKIIENLKNKGYNLDWVEIISLYHIFNDADQNPVKMSKYYSVCKLWIDGNSNVVDIVESFNKKMLNKINANKLSKKYIPDIYISERLLRKNARVFAAPSMFVDLLQYYSNALYKGSVYNYVKDKKAIIKGEKELSFNNDCNITEVLRSGKSKSLKTIVEKLDNYSNFIKGDIWGIKYLDKLGNTLGANEVHSNIYSSLHFFVDELLELYNITQKQIFFIIKDAGQGKTNFLCDFCENVLLKRRVPVLYVNVNELTNTLLDHVKEQIQNCCNKDYFSALEFLKQYCECIDRKVIIVIDGLNEKNNLPAFRREVLELFRFIEENDLFKVIATSRYVAYETFYMSFCNESFGSKIYASIEKKDYHKGIRFQQKLYEKYKSYFGFTCYVSKIAKSKLTKDTFLLRIFSEVYQKNATAIVNDIFLYKIFNGYIDKRASQLEVEGRIKRKSDLFDFLSKIAKSMANTKELNNFSNLGFSSEEKDLLDIIVNEDIIIKTYENDPQLLQLPKTNFSFTYDEFRDYLIAMYYTSIENEIFAEEYHNMAINKGRYDGVLKYLFLILKSMPNDKLKIMMGENIYSQLYETNIFSVEDDLLTNEDVKTIENELRYSNQWVIYNLCNRLDCEHYKRLSVLNLANYKHNEFTGKDRDWEQLFVTKDYMGKDIGIIPNILHTKIEDIVDNEIYGLLVLLSSFPRWTCEDEKKFIKSIYLKNKAEVEGAINKIKKDFPKFIGKIYLLSEVNQ